MSNDIETCETINNQQYSQYMNTFPEQITSPGCNSNTLTWTSSHSPPFFPAMSVNVSMNMTMQGYPTRNSPPVAADDLSPQLPCHQVSKILHQLFNSKTVTTHVSSNLDSSLDFCLLKYGPKSTPPLQQTQVLKFGTPAWRHLFLSLELNAEKALSRGYETRVEVQMLKLNA